MKQAKERPIIFSGDMVRAILEDRKTQTRRVVKVLLKDKMPANQVCEDGGGNWIAWSGAISEKHDMAEETKRQYPNGEGFKCPHGKPGGRLYVKETLALEVVPGSGSRGPIAYRADCDREMNSCPFPRAEYGAWESTMFMPRARSRILLEVVSVRVERVQSITKMDAIAEGIQLPLLFADEPVPSADYAQRAYSFLWDSINGKKTGCSWADNCWVWVVEFKVLEVTK
jgi:hypothetical protein